MEKKHPHTKVLMIQPDYLKYSCSPSKTGQENPYENYFFRQHIPQLKPRNITWVVYLYVCNIHAICNIMYKIRF